MTTRYEPLPSSLEEALAVYLRAYCEDLQDPDDFDCGEIADVGRRLALHQIVTAALAVAERHHDELLAVLLGELPGPTMPATQAGAEVAA